ncbi:MAG: TonB family protein [candidate division WOR-3 bacterium]|nr:MAG: TonB family protein [candidate division WOR-3 bacterium]
MRRCLIVAMVLALGILSCRGKVEKTAGEPGGILTVGTMEMPAAISPLQPSIFSSNEILDLLFLRLHEIDPATGKMKPILAESWEFSEDLKSITYYLRKGVTWWDGEPVTAHDVLYTYEQMKEPSNNYPNVNMLRFIDSVEVLNDFAIKFSFDKVYADILTDSDIMPVPKHIHEQLGSDFGTSPVGNGPYRLNEWVPGSGIILVANETYYTGRPALDQIHIRLYRNTNEMVDDFREGDLEMMFSITPGAADAIRNNENVEIYSEAGNSYLYIGWNLDHPFLQDVFVRKALTMAIDRQRILRDIYDSRGEISLGPLPPSSWAYNSEVPPVTYDVDGARSLLQEQGYSDYNRNRVIDKDRREFTLRLITNVENPDRLAILRYIAEDLQKIGIRVITQTLEANDFIDVLISGQFDGFVMGWRVGDKIDPTLYWHSRGRYNLVSYSNTLVDSLIDMGITMLDRNRARAIWSEFQRIVYEEQPYSFLVVPDRIAAAHKRVRGIDHEVRLASTSEYWIPEAERRVSVASAIPPANPSPEVPVGVTSLSATLETTGTALEEPPTVIAPENLIEAAAQRDTAVVDTGTASLVAELPPPPPKPSVITRAEAVRRVQPKYPAAAREFEAAGTIVVRVLVDTDGSVKDATIIKSFGNPACEQAALDAARQWEFKPATKDGAPFEQRVSIPFTFTP